MDVDLDVQRKTKPEQYFNVIRASRIDKNEIKKHNVGVYFQNIPVDPVSKLSAIPYKEAEKLGYLKIDFLTLDILDYFDNNEQIKKLAEIEPDWSLLNKRENVEKLFQIHKQFDIISRIKPKSIEELADCLALIRPGKRFLIDEYIKNPKEIRKILYVSTDNFSFKKSHAIAYAINIVLQLHLLKAGII